jgi:hypothetical protein
MRIKKVNCFEITLEVTFFALKKQTVFADSIHTHDASHCVLWVDSV